ncbi:hypothetical protein SAMN04488065_0807 [Haloplanus vescus]|uniref:Uncharacterized protein n=1 Tax=Haloplanus vescus TaxID=555874 RepID=A0A1H3WGP8_9EURY|nr:hypothetical protein [Haloplanus vescus]SDZ85574.1 hypothetical protein SAMN04488065_0807 [Haloplanus vescus]
MAPVTMPPVEAAQDVFRRLGYSVERDGVDLRAERKWRTVHVTALDADEASSPDKLRADGGTTEYRLRCFVTWMEAAGDLRDRLARTNPDYEWAVIGVEDDDYEVVDHAVGA